MPFAIPAPLAFNCQRQCHCHHPFLEAALCTVEPSIHAAIPNCTASYSVTAFAAYHRSLITLQVVVGFYAIHELYLLDRPSFGLDNYIVFLQSLCSDVQYILFDSKLELAEYYY